MQDVRDSMPWCGVDRYRGILEHQWAYDARADDGTLARELRAESVAPPQPGSLGAWPGGMKTCSRG